MPKNVLAFIASGLVGTRYSAAASRSLFVRPETLRTCTSIAATPSPPAPAIHFSAAAAKAGRSLSRIGETFSLRPSGASMNRFTKFRGRSVTLPMSVFSAELASNALISCSLLIAALIAAS